MGEPRRIGGENLQLRPAMRQVAEQRIGQCLAQIHHQPVSLVHGKERHINAVTLGQGRDHVPAHRPIVALHLVEIAQTYAQFFGECGLREAQPLADFGQAAARINLFDSHDALVCRSPIFTSLQIFFALPMAFAAATRKTPLKSLGEVRSDLHAIHPRTTRSPPRQCPAWRRPAPYRQPTCQGQADGPRKTGAFARRRLVRRVRHVCRPSLHRFRDGGEPYPRRRRDHRLGHDQWPSSLCLQPGFHGFRRLAQRNPCAKDLQDHGYGHEIRRAS